MFTLMARPSRLSRGRRALVTAWQHMVGDVPLEKILPLGFGGSTDVRVAAFYGDKVLGAALALAQQRAPGVQTVGSLTHTQSLAASNGFLHSRLGEILPRHAAAFDRSYLRDPSHGDHGAGTMVEAAVAAVHATDATGAAVADLAEWLVREAQAAPSEPKPGTQMDRHAVNAKGQLLELGGKVVSERVGGPDHEPIFRAFATVEGQSTTVELRTSSRKAEQQAAAQLLRTFTSRPE